MTDASSDRDDSVDETRSDGGPARELLLEESRSTLDKQLGQLDKIDDAAVRTVRISLVVLGILAGGSRFVSFPKLGAAGYAGTVSLVLALVGSVTVYGTSRVFIGSAPDEIGVSYRGRPIVETAHVEVLTEYEAGISDNRRTLLANGVLLATARALLALAILLLFYAFVGGGSSVPPEPAESTTNALTLMILQAESSDTMSEREPVDREDEVSRPVSVYTGPKSIADAKVALGKWLEERRS